MSAFGWITVARRAPLAAWLRRSHAPKKSRRRLAPFLEPLETIDLLSRSPLALPAISAMTAPITPNSIRITSTRMAAAIQTTASQVVVVPQNLTNFSIPYTPPINLFNPALGTLLAVHVSETVNLAATIKSQNTSTSSPADITPTLSGGYTINGLSSTVIGNLPTPTIAAFHVPAFNGTDAPFTGASTVYYGNPPTPAGIPTSNSFPALGTSDTQTFNFSDPASLAFFTSSTGRSTISPILTANGGAGAGAPNGNLETDVRTLGQGQITVTYDYTPVCPTVVKLVRYGIHHQPTQLQVFYSTPVATADAQNTNNYRIVVPNAHGSFTGPGVTYIPIKSATYDPITQSVALIPARQLNVHHMFQLQINLPCNNGNLITIEFGGKKSLGGFTDPVTGKFVPVVNGKIPPRYLK